MELNKFRCKLLIEFNAETNSINEIRKILEKMNLSDIIALEVEFIPYFDD